MSGAAESGSPRPRPLSGGFWTLLSWLRREEQSSNESLSSVGSDKTAISFAFLSPAHYPSASSPVILPPQGPPSDTYKRRVRERNLRRQYDRDTTLHRKYGLFRGEGSSGYDGFSLPPVRRGAASGSGVDRAERARRAASECCPRRAAHVPGKRRAPPPPPPQPAQPQPQLTVSTARRRARKRPAPLPPIKITEKSKENIVSCRNNIAVTQMNQPVCNAREVGKHEAADVADCKPEKYTKKDLRDDKTKSEKSFLKQIFENKKRNSAVDVSTVKVLPSISELDRQAAEIIENKKLKNAKDANRHKSESNICHKCYTATCICSNNGIFAASSSDFSHKNASTTYTQTGNGSYNPALINKDKLDEKQKLKNMLKEMKDSLPKRPKHENKLDSNDGKSERSSILAEREASLTDTPTLRIGSSGCIETTKNVSPFISHTKEKETQVFQRKKKALHGAIINNNNQNTKPLVSDQNKPRTVNDDVDKNRLLGHGGENHKEPNNILIEKNKKLHTPLKISSLLNPIYVPKNTAPSQNLVNPEGEKEDKNVQKTTNQSEPIYVKTADTVRDIILNSVISGNITHSPQQKVRKSPEKLQQSFSQQPSTSKEISKNKSNLDNNVISNLTNKNIGDIERLSEHSRRRELVSQLEQSIAKGDEHAAAEAATKLAQLRLSCSVLSFTSQILGEPSTFAMKPISSSTQIVTNKEPKKYTGPLTVKQDEEEKSKAITTDVSRGALHIKENNRKTNDLIPEKNKNNSIGTSKASIQNELDGMKSIQIWIEDKEKARGPIQLHVKRKSNVGDLRRQAEQSLGLPARLQRWIVGRALCSDDNTPLISLAGENLNAPFYLCLVESGTTNNGARNLENSSQTHNEVKDDRKQQDNEKKTSTNVYSELVNLERQALVPNAETFECEICMEQCKPGDGAVLRDCVHSFCRACLSDVVRHCEEPTVSCPATGCPGEIHEREIRALVSADDYQRWLARGLAAAESGTRNAFHCRTRDCSGWALCEIEVRRFPCPVCKHTNCVPCRAIHENETCEQYQAKLLAVTSTNTVAKTDEGTEALIDSLISRGEALQCPECTAVITKKWGCDWLKCSACKTEICWVTRGRRWGPGGRGDTSGGCRCGVDGKRCHPSCGYCH